jgi:hypothetical protein
LHTWKSLGGKLEGISVDDKHLGQTIVTFDYSAPGKSNRYYYSARVPVPRGKETEMKSAVAEITRTHLPAEI